MTKTKEYSSWLVQVHYSKAKMADVRHLENENRPYLRKSSTDRHEIWHGDAYWPSVADR